MLTSLRTASKTSAWRVRRAPGGSWACCVSTWRSICSSSAVGTQIVTARSWLGQRVRVRVGLGVGSVGSVCIMACYLLMQIPAP